MAWANSSFPVPDSPRSRTVARVRAACRAWSMAMRIPSLSPMMSSKVYLASRVRMIRRARSSSRLSRLISDMSGMMPTLPFSSPSTMMGATLPTTSFRLGPTFIGTPRTGFRVFSTFMCMLSPSEMSASAGFPITSSGGSPVNRV